MRISLITPTRNQAEFLPATLESIRAQNDPDLEHIVLDAMSTDATPDILDTYAKGTGAKVIREPDGGQSNAINKGMKMATGEICGWLNSDDTLCEGALQKLRETFDAHPGAAVVYGVGSKMDRQGKVLRTVPYREFDRNHLRTAYRVIQPSMYFRRDVYWEAGGLDESLEYAMDWELLIRLSFGREVVSIPDEISRIRYYEETKTNTGGWERMEEIAMIGRKYNGVFDPNYVAYRVRRIASSLPGRFPRWLADQILWNLWPNRPVMVQGWPDEPSE